MGGASAVGRWSCKSCGSSYSVAKIRPPRDPNVTEMPLPNAMRHQSRGLS
jgi:hypothetical protein